FSSTRTPPTHTYTLSLHDALPICADASTDNTPIRLLAPGTRLHLAEQEPRDGFLAVETNDAKDGWVWKRNVKVLEDSAAANRGRSEEHTSELQSLRHLVCRLLLEK